MKFSTLLVVVLLLGSCSKKNEVPQFELDSFEFVTHQSALVSYVNTSDMDEYPSGLQVQGPLLTSNGSVHFFDAIFSPEKRQYSTMLFDLLPNTEYKVQFYYGHQKIASEVYSFRTDSVEFFTDPRDGQQYWVGKFGQQVWMLENLNYSIPNSVGFSDSPQLGLYYTWESALNACPPGWHLPTDEEWIELERFVGVPESQLRDTSQVRGNNEIAQLLVPTRFTLYGGLPVNSIVNERGFSLKACGFFSENELNVRPEGFGLNGYYWSSTGFTSTDAFYHGTSVQSVVGSQDRIGAVRMYTSKNNLLNVRCVKD